MKFLVSFSLLLLSAFFPASQAVPVTQEDPPTDNPKCSLCNQVVNEVFRGLEFGLTNEQIVDALVKKCTDLQLISEKVCRGTATLAAPTVRYIYNHSKVIQGNVCGILLQAENCTLSHPDKLEWAITPSNRSKPVLPPSILPPEETGSTNNTIKVLHIADPHWDPEYLEGSLANCKDTMCCRATSGNVSRTEDAAGYWGDYRSCDMPWRTIEKAVAHMASQHPDVAYIVWTGDIVPHANWVTSKQESLMIHERLMNLMKQYFPSTPLYPTLGNHESHPVNSFAPPEITDPEMSTAWLYDDAIAQWSKWLPADVFSTIRHGGYYTTLVRPGLRVVSMNMNYCYTLNWWTLYKSEDPASGLLWLRGVLEEAEEANEKVHILSHIPPGNSDCWSIWSREFAKIINRFESTVTAQFYGHTHHDEFKIFYDDVEFSRPVNLAFIAGSLTSFSDLNPSYRVYTVDGPRPGATWSVTDFSTWIMNLTAANEQGPDQEPHWFELYRAKEEYGLKDLSPNSVEQLLHRMLEEDDLFNLYFKNFHKDADTVVPKGCDAKCRAKMLCPVVTTNIADQGRCNRVKQHILGHQDL